MGDPLTYITLLYKHQEMQPLPSWKISLSYATKPASIDATKFIAGHALKEQHLLRNCETTLEG